MTAGTFTIGTDNPAYPPYFLENDGGANTAPWELGDPTTGDGFESAVGFAIADKLGFAKDEVTWVVVPFANSFAPGPKTFDIVLNQVTFKPERAQTADLSDGYYFGNQSLVALKSSPVAKVTSIAELKDFEFGAQVGTTSYDAITTVIAPTKDPRSSTPTTPRSRPSRTARSTASSSTCRPPTSSRTSSSTTRPSSASSPAAPRALQRGPDQGQPADGRASTRRSRR